MPNRRLRNGPVAKLTPQPLEGADRGRAWPMPLRIKGCLACW